MMQLGQILHRISHVTNKEIERVYTPCLVSELHAHLLYTKECRAQDREGKSSITNSDLCSIPYYECDLQSRSSQLCPPTT